MSANEILDELDRSWRSDPENAEVKNDGEESNRDELHERQPFLEFFQSAGGEALDLKRKRDRSRTIKL